MNEYGGEMPARFQCNQAQRSVRRVGVRLRFYARLVAALIPGLGVAGGYVSSEIETGMPQAIIHDDLLAIGEGRENYAATVLKIPMVTASEVALAYAENKRTADGGGWPIGIAQLDLISGALP
ncbi:hypothetical protein [Burkholderia diffusa]|uniref:hypothetical protein n=1 Tax=Burkholderia diffusa TaxID=488732 RepID=UPI00124865DA|nr:hypothetical protein [Burkholderia diffusa]KAB0657277.1 hypothetical protein F7R23_11505 [Burkholderia diffusa]MBM2654867.1 hypothetical protein [Burkholderia diffusa]